MKDAVIAYHFTGDKLRDGRPVPPVGEVLVHEGPVRICHSGLHASVSPFDALMYAPGATLHKVLCEGIEETQSDKLVCRRRTILATIDAEYLLRRFAADQALSVAHLWDVPYVVRDYLKSLDASKRVAAAEASAWAAEASAWARAARAAAEAAAAEAAAAEAAAWAAVEAAWARAARAAAEAEANLSKARNDFEERVFAAFAMLEEK